MGANEYLVGYDALLESMDGEDAFETMMSDKMNVEEICKNLNDPNLDLTTVYTDDEIDAIFKMVDVGKIPLPKPNS